ncbi:MAG: hypothetical protein V8S98_11585 [Lachnospiraceae bacterium]
MAWVIHLMYLVLKRLKHGIDRWTVLLMFLNGCAAGAAMATKWTGVYAGAGIALMFFLFLCGNIYRNMEKGIS